MVSSTYTQTCSPQDIVFTPEVVIFLHFLSHSLYLQMPLLLTPLDLTLVALE